MEKEVGFPICDGWVDLMSFLTCLLGTWKWRGWEMLGQTFNSMNQLVDMKIVSSIRPGSSQIFLGCLSHWKVMRVHGRDHGSFLKGLCNMCFCGGNMEPMIWYDMLFERNRCHSECIHFTRIRSCPLLLFGRFLTSQQAILVNFWRRLGLVPQSADPRRAEAGCVQA